MSPHQFHRVRTGHIRALIEAALDQPRPTPELTRCVNHLCYLINHPNRRLDAQTESSEAQAEEAQGNGGGI